MTELIQARLPDGEVIWVLFDDDGPADVGLTDRLVPLTGLTEAVRGLVANVQKGLDGVRPDGLTVEFGLDLGLAETGIVAALVGGQANASIKVTASWTPSRPQQ